MSNKWAVCSYKGELLKVYDTFPEASAWVGEQYDTSAFYIRPATEEDNAVHD